MHGADAGLLAQLALGGLLGRLAGPDEPAGKREHPALRLLQPAREQHAQPPVEQREDDRVGGQADRRVVSGGVGGLHRGHQVTIAGMEFIDRLEEPRRSEIAELHELIRDVAPELEVQAGKDMIGYGPFHYRYASGREGDAHLLALVAAQELHLDLRAVHEGRRVPGRESYTDRLPKADIGKSCVRFKRPSDVDLGELRELLAEAVRLGPPA